MHTSQSVGVHRQQGILYVWKLFNWTCYLNNSYVVFLEIFVTLWLINGYVKHNMCCKSVVKVKAIFNQRLISIVCCFYYTANKNDKVENKTGEAKKTKTTGNKQKEKTQKQNWLWHISILSFSNFC